MLIKKVNGLQGTLAIPGDKSISHRSIMFGSLASGKTTIFNFLMGDDCLSTIACFRQLGIEITVSDQQIDVYGKGLYGLTEPSDILDCGNSGTTTRLISGILAGQNFMSTLTGDASIQKRPMNRIMNPLTMMSAHITGKDNNFCPLTISPSSLKGITYASPVASAQVKSAILLAGLYADSPTTVSEPHLSRDHTERMLASFGAQLERDGNAVTIYPGTDLQGQEIIVPGDISSAAFFMVAGLITPHSCLTLTNVGINPSRRGILDVLLAMGGDIKIMNEREVCGEPVCDLIVRSSTLHGVTVEGAIIPTLIDEVPILAVCACFATGITTIKDASELKVKETNRIDAVTTELRKMGAHITPTNDGLIIAGEHPLHGTTLETYHDHRMAMSLSIAAINAHSPTTITGSECISISYPTFYEDLAAISR